MDTAEAAAPGAMTATKPSNALTMPTITMSK
jgi:hypothetical protein